MEKTLEVLTSDLRTAASAYGERGRVIASTMESMLSLVTGLTAGYEGDASQAYINAFGRLQDDMERINNKIKGSASDLETVADDYDRTVSSITEADSALPSNPLG
ncbi:MAG TPA: WXG100 family type VII secretion target [Candidatus Merdisoma merdipullorum]|nr:WXG100 family type VII secretion target [Candidatus Merdisoma merdipullorum]